MNELISVIIPAYNAEQTIAECVDSVLYQTYPYKEIIIVDDGSQDDTAKIIRKKYSAIPSVKYFFMEHTGFEGAVRNYGIRQASGLYISFLDSDDYWDKQVLSKLMDTLIKNHDTAVCYGSLIYHGGKLDGKKVHDFRAPHTGFVFWHLLAKNFMPVHPALVRKKAIEKSGFFDETIKIGPDYDFWLRVTYFFPVEYCPDAFGYYRIHDESVFHKAQLSERNLNLLRVILKIKRMFKIYNTIIYKRLAVLHLTIAKNLYDETHFMSSMCHLVKFLNYSFFYYSLLFWNKQKHAHSLFGTTVSI